MIPTKHDSGAAAPTHVGGGARLRRARAPLAFLLLASLCAVAVAAEVPKFPEWGDPVIEANVDEWKAKLKPPAIELCTGMVSGACAQSTRNPADSTPAVPNWKPLGGERTDGAGQFETHAGSDTEALGSDSFLYVKLVGIGASVYCKAILQAEDGARSQWSVRYMGEETMHYVNGPNRRAETYTVANPWEIGWTRRIVDLDAVEGEYDEEKAIDPALRGAMRTRRRKQRRLGEFVLAHGPDVIASTTSGGLKFRAGSKFGAAAGTEYGGELGFEGTAAKTYDTSFHELTDSSDPMSGTATVGGAIPCPYATDWRVATYVNADFSIYDHEALTGDFGSRQEFLLTVINFIASVRVEKCHGCGTGIPPLPPDPNPTPRTPTDPSPTATPGTAVLPTTGIPLCGGLVLPTTSGPVITAPNGQEPGWGGVPASTPDADPARGPSLPSSK